MHTGEGSPASWTWNPAGDDMDSTTLGADINGKRLVVYSHCLDGSAGGAHFASDLDIIKRCNADVILLQDPRWNPVQDKSVVDDLTNHWSSNNQLWSKYWPGMQPKNKRHGVFVAVRSPWNKLVSRAVQDERGWARFGGVVIQGDNGGVAFVSLYAPTFSDAAADVNWQRDQIEHLDLGMTPWELCRHDLKNVVRDLQSEGIVCIVAGDTNSTWDMRARLHDPDSSMRGHISAWHKWAELLPLKNVMRLRAHGPMPTFTRENTTNDMDAIFITSGLPPTCVQRAGVLTSTSKHPKPSDSEHYPVAAEFNLETILGIDGETLRNRAEVLRHNSPVKVANTKACRQFATAAKRAFEAANYIDRVTQMERRDDVKSETHFSEANVLFNDIISSITGASDVIQQRKAAVWHRHNDDGATALRVELSALRRVLSATATRSGFGRRTKILERVIQQHPAIALTLDLSSQRISSWMSHAGSYTDNSAADIAALHATAKVEAHDLSSRISQTSRANVRKQFATDAQTLNRRGKRCYRNLTDFVMTRSRRGGHYASLVSRDTSSHLASVNDGGLPTATGGRPPRYKVTSKPKEVAQGLVDQFFKWMGGDKTFWFSDTKLDSTCPAGRALRQSILDGTLSDLASANIPIHFKPVIAALKRVSGASGDMYTSVLDEITTEEWTRKLATTKKGTAPGLSRESIDMLASLTTDCSDVLRRIINVMLRGRRVFKQWLQRAICPIPKEPGNSDVAMSRPITLLSVSGKVFWAIVTDRITSIWRANNLLQPQQYGFRNGVGTDEPLIIATLAAEQCFDLQQPLIATSQDVSKAFDSVSRGFKTLAFGRLGLPDDFCELFASMDENNETVVVTAYGTSAEVLGAEKGTFECKRGYAQGCTSSAAIGWTSFYDILLALQNDIGVDGGTFRVVGDDCGECDRSTLAFADDALYMAGGPCTSSPRRSTELKLAVASLFFAFTGGAFNAKKTVCCAMEFPEHSGAYTSAAEDGDWFPCTYKLEVLFAGGELCLLSPDAVGGKDHIGRAEHRLESITMIPVADGFRYLGPQFSPRLDANVAHGLIANIVDELLERFRAVPVGGDETRFLLEQIMWAKIGHRLRFDRFAPDTFVTYEKQARELLLHRGGRLNTRMDKSFSGTSAALGGPGIPAWYDLVMADRLGLVQRHLDCNSSAAPSIRAAILRCQEKFGSATPVFESPLARDTAWLEPDRTEHGWVESLAVWCAERNISLNGGCGLPGAAENDAAVVDLAPSGELHRLMQRSSNVMDQHWASDYLLLDGHTVNEDAVHYISQRSKIRKCVRQSLAKWADNPMPRLNGNSIKAGDILFARSDEGIQLVEIVTVSGSDVRAVVLERATQDSHRSCFIGKRVFARRNKKAAWQPGVVTAQTSNCRLIVERPSGIEDASIYISRENIRPFSAVPRLWADGASWSADDDSAVWIKSADQHLFHIARAVRLPTKRHDCTGFVSIRINDEYFQKIILRLDALATFTDVADAAPPDPSLSDIQRQLNVGAFESVVHERCSWQGGIHALHSPSTIIASDGGYDHMDTGGWGLVVCTPNATVMGAGRVTGGVGTNSSFRSESYGLLAGLKYVFATQAEDDIKRIEGDVKHIIDNQSVVKVFQNCETRGPWLVSSQDVWDEIIWHKRQLGGAYKVEWRRGHAEKRGKISHIEDRANHLADGLAAAGYTAAIDIRQNFRHGRRWHVRMDGVRHFDDIRSSVKYHIGMQRLRTYYDSHEDDLRPLDIGILRAICAGKSSKSMFSRAENSKFMHQQLATRVRLRRWGFNVPDISCRACHRAGSEETLFHLLILCQADACVYARRAWLTNLIKSLRRKAVRTSADISDFLNKRLMISASGQLTYSASARAAFGFVTGFLPTDCIAFLRNKSREDDMSVHRFIVLLRRSCSRLLWWPVWMTTKTISTDILPGIVSNDHPSTNDHTGYTSDTSDARDE